MAKKSDASLLLTLCRADLPSRALYVGQFLESAIGSEVLKAEWQKTNLRKATPLNEALFAGYWQLKSRADEFAVLARNRGTLLFAHAGTTVLTGGAA